MCFSASASFGLGTALMATGVLTVKRAVTPTQIPFALIPIFFSIQQFVEGFLWLSLTHSSWQGWHLSATYIFLVFAQVLWPSWVPFSIFLMEENVSRKRILLALTGFGSVVSFYVLFALFNYNINSSIKEHHISYDLYFPDYIINLSGVFYFIPTVLPAFVSTVKSMVYLALFLLLSFLVTKLFYNEYIISVWCYFAAAISVVVVVVISALQKKTKHSLTVKNIP